MSIIKEEVPDENFIIKEEDIKVEESQLEDENIQNFVYPQQLVIVEEKLSVCVRCKSTFNRKPKDKLLTETDLLKCNKCVLHSRLNQVFNVKSKRKGRKKQNLNVEKVKLEVDEEVEKVVKKVFNLCSICRSLFQRSSSIGLKEPSDWTKCNKCILHTRLNTVFKLKKK